jgi:tripartite-type tricarboxylate transporter receptor subunit TctC
MNVMRSFAKELLRCLCAAFCFGALGLGTAAADDFYKGRTITFIIGTAPGGGYDTYSRLLASHLGQQLAGGPAIVPQNMPGAGGIRAANYLFNVAPRDGTVIGMLDEALYLNQILGTQEIKADAGKFNWIGRILANSAVLFARRDAAVRKIDDAFDKELIVSATGTASKLNWTVLKNALGMKLKIISGYQGTNESLLALVRGEADALSMPWSILRITGAQLLADRQINLLLQTGAEKDPGLPDLPRMIDLARNEEDRQLLALFSSPSLIGRSVLAPPGTSPERVSELRRAFTATLQDARFLDDLAKARLELTPLPGEALQAAVARMGEFPEPLVERARRVSDMVRN